MRKVFYVLPLSLLTLLISFITVKAQPGTPISGFGTSGVAFTDISGGSANDVTTSMAVQNDGKIVIAGYTDVGGGLFEVAVTRFNPDGSLDASFDTDGIVTITSASAGVDAILGVAIQSDGNIVLAGVVNFGAGGAQDLLVMRLLGTDGSLDATFGTGGIVTTDVNSGSIDIAAGIAIQPDGNIVVGVSTTGAGGDFGVVRYDATGALDGTFGTGGIVVTDLNTSSEDVPSAVALQSDGSIVLAGFTNTAADNDFAVVRYTSAGALDGTFGTGGITITDISGGGSADEAFALAIDAGGSILLAGFSDNGGATNEDFAILKYTSAGALDGTFGTGGILLTDIGAANTDDRATGIAVQNDGKYVVAGSSGNGDFNVARYSSLGVPDATFGTAGFTSIDISSGNPDLPTAIKLTNLRIYVGGTRLVASVGDFAIAAFESDASALPLNILSFTAQKQNNDIVLQWQTEKEESIVQFIVERSSDGRNFSAIGSLAPAKTGSLVKNYTFYDKQPLAAVNYYRLAIKEVDEHTIHSKILAIKFNKQASKQLEVFPNPAVGNSLRMQLPDGLNGKISIQVMDATGRIVRRMNVQTNGGSSIATFLDVSGLQKGVYILKLEGALNTITKRFIKN